MEQYILKAGKHSNSEGLAHAVTDYWNSLEDMESPALADQELAPSRAREWFRRMGYHWVGLKGVYKDGRMSLYTDKASSVLLPVGPLQQQDR